MMDSQVVESSTSSRFVLLRHEMPQDAVRASHWDLMIEFQGAFVTYALEILPDSPGLYLAQTLPDHRLDYWNLEGPISGNRGSVQRVTRGHAEIGHLSGSVRLYTLESPELRASLLVLPERNTSSITLKVVRWAWSNGNAQRQDSAC